MNVPSPLGLSARAARREAVRFDVARALRDEVVPVGVHVERVAQPADGRAARRSIVNITVELGVGLRNTHWRKGGNQ